MTFDTIIAKLEAATEGSETLDVAICRAIGGYTEDTPLWHVLDYTRSLDTAVTLVPDGMSLDLYINGTRQPSFNEASVIEPIRGRDEQNRRITTFRKHTASANREGTLHWNIPPIIICIAALKARASQSKEHP